MQLSGAKIRYPDPSEIKKSDKKNRVSVYTEDYKGEFYNIPVNKLIPFKNQARVFFDDESITSLAKTIQEHGIRQPLTIIPSPQNEGLFEIVSGERRYRAAKLINLSVVPCIIIHDIQKAEEIALIENIQRKDLHPVELLKAFQNLLDTNICTSTQEIADKLGIQKSRVVEILNLRHLPEATKNMLVEKSIKSRRLLRDLLKSSAESHIVLINKYLNNQFNSPIKQNDTKQSHNHKKTNIITIVLDKANLSISKNKITKLSSEQKSQLNELLSSLITE